MHIPITYSLYKTTSSGTYTGALDMVIGEACIARIIPITRFANKLWAIRSLEENLHKKLFHSPAEAAEAMMQLINWKD